MFDGNLGEQQTAASALRDDQAVTPDFDRLGMNREQKGEHAQRNSKPGSLLPRHRRETGILESGGTRGFGHGAIERRDGHGITDASSKLTTEFAAETAGEVALRIGWQRKSREDAPWLRQPGL